MFTARTSQQRKKQFSLTLLAPLLLSLTTQLYALQSDNQQLLHIKSQTLTLNLTQRNALYAGNVYAMQGTRKMWGNTLQVNQNAQGKFQSLIIHGTPAKTQTLPKAGDAMLYAQALKIIYLPLENLLRYEHKARMSQADNVFNGSQFIYNTLTRRISGPSTEAVPSTIILPPYDQNRLIHHDNTYS